MIWVHFPHFFFYFLWPFSQNLAVTIHIFSDNVEIIRIPALIAIWWPLSASILWFSARIHRIKGLICNVTSTYQIQLHRDSPQRFSDISESWIWCSLIVVQILCCISPSPLFRWFYFSRFFATNMIANSYDRIIFLSLGYPLLIQFLNNKYGTVI